MPFECHRWDQPLCLEGLKTLSTPFFFIMERGGLTDTNDFENKTKQAIKRVKTVSVDCLVANNFEKSCLHDRYVPFSSATQVFLAAFNSTDPKYGGCPDVPPPASSSIQDSLRPRW